MSNQNRKEGHAVKKRLICCMLTLVLAAGMLGAGFSYYEFVSRTICAESTAHLVEIFHQANQRFLPAQFETAEVSFFLLVLQFLPAESLRAQLKVFQNSIESP